MQSVYNNPTQVYFGCGALARVKEIGKKFGEKILIITDEGVSRSGLLDRLIENTDNFKVTVFEDVESNPSIETVEKAVGQAKNFGAEFIIALGGGSPLDAAKAVSILMTNGGSIRDYEGVDKIPKKNMPIIAIPTTAGTASEVTINVVITDKRDNYKFTIVSINAAASVAILDPELTVSMPPHITAATGLDALVHAIESFTSRAAYNLTETLALKAIKLISDNLRKAVYNGENLQARENMLMGSLMAGLAFNNTRLGNAHAMSHPVSAIFNVPHGVANAILIPYVMDYNVPACPEKFKDIAVAMGINVEGKEIMAAAYSAVEAVKQLNRDVNLPEKLSEVGVTIEEINRMAEDAMKSGNILVNPRKTKLEDVIKLYREAI